MKKDSQEHPEQLNNEAPEEFVVEETFELEDIIREFGGWTKEEPEEKPRKKEPEEKPRGKEPEEAPRKKEPEEAPRKKEPEEPKAEEKKAKVRLVDMSGDTIAFRAIREEDLIKEREKTAASVEMPAEPEAVPDEKQLRAERKARRRTEARIRKLEAQRRKARKAELRAARKEEPEVVYPSAEEAFVDYGKTGNLRLRLSLSALLCAVSVAMLLFGSMKSVSDSGGFAVIMLALLIVQCILSYEVFLRGVYQALKLRFDLNSLLTLTVLIGAADGFASIAQKRLPFCTAVSVLVLISVWSVYLEKKAKWRTLKTALSMENPTAAVKKEKAWNEQDCVFRAEGSLHDFTAMLETPDASQKTMRIYAPVMAVISLVLAAVVSIGGQAEFLWAWAAMLTAAIPVGGAIACCRPFAVLAKRLEADGAAICGWRGAKLLSGECGIVIEDSDLFPKSNITMNGMKMYSDLPARQVVGYATAVIQAAGSGLLPLFEEVMKQEDGRRYTADSFRQYEGGGLGAEIRGDVVLLGSLAFMRLMGIHVPEGTRVQSALYISVNRELVGVFALTYQPSPGTKNGLSKIARNVGLTPVLATRDFMITPALIKKRYKISVDRVEFPVVAERIQLSSKEAGEGGQQGALMAKENFMSFASAVTGGRLLRKAVHSSVALALFCGILGLTLISYLAGCASVEALSALNLFLYQIIWMVPTLLTTGLVGKT